MAVATPQIVVLCGSSRFKEAFERTALEESLAGRIVLSLALYAQADSLRLSSKTVKTLHELHRAKIRMADKVVVVNVGGYIGDSTKREIKFAEKLGKPVRYTFSQDSTDRTPK